MRFVNPLWLLAAGAMVWPVVFHLIRRQRFQRMELATLRFLIEAVEERRSFRRIENWPLLAVRALAVAALAFLLARPFRAGSAMPREEGAAAIVLADVSGSQARGRGVDLPAAARKWIDALPTGSQLAFARFADAVETVNSAAELRVAPGAKTDFAHAIEWTFDRLAQSSAPLTRVLIVSDFSREPLRALTPRLWPPFHRVFHHRGRRKFATAPRGMPHPGETANRQIAPHFSKLHRPARGRGKGRRNRGGRGYPGEIRVRVRSSGRRGEVRFLG